MILVTLLHPASAWSLGLTEKIQLAIDLKPSSGQANEPARFVPDIKFPGVFEDEPIDNQLMGKYIKAVYIYMVYVVVILAVVMLIFGGVKWVAAAGNAAQIRDAKDVVNNAIIGIVIALGSYLLLFIINPKLLNLDLPSVTTVATQYFEGANVTDVCTIETQDSKGLKCGQLFKTGTAKDRQGSSIDSYCIATRCGTPFAVGDNTTFGVCSLRYDTSIKKYRPGRGCLDRFEPVVSRPVAGGATGPAKVSNGDIIVSMPLERVDVHNILYSCGYTTKGYSIGTICKNLGDQTDNRSYCYMMGDQVEFPVVDLVVSTDECKKIEGTNRCKQIGGVGSMNIRDGTPANNFNCPRDK